MNILVTGGLGYIGSLVVLRLIDIGCSPIVIDNLSNSKKVTHHRIEKISKKNLYLYEGSILDRSLLNKIFHDNKIDTVMHFAGLKSVHESYLYPIKYYQNNAIGTIELISAMRKNGTRSIIFSSSATVYGEPESLPIKEGHSLNPTNVYGKTKLIVENILSDLAKSDEEWKVVNLRYFNPIGSHPSSLIGEDPKHISDNLMPRLISAALNKDNQLKIYGNDYDTFDGTPIRDYIHVMDLVEGHISSLKLLEQKNGIFNINLGTGKGTSVLELIKSFERVTGKKINFSMTERRIGDVGEIFCDPSLAKQILNWSANFDIDEMCKDAWLWSKNL